MFKSEVVLVKRLVLLPLVALLALGAVSCTRDKPAEPTALPTVVSQVVIPPSPTLVILPSSPITLTNPVTPTVELPPPLIAITPTVAPPPTLAPTAAPIPTTPSTYTVQWGDWLNKIAGQFGTTTQALLAANPGINPNMIYPGTVLKIPSASAPVATITPGGATPTPAAPPALPSTYTVQQGEWIYSIARKLGISPADLQRANPGIMNPNFLVPGKVLSIPGGGSGATVPTPTTGTPPSGATYTVKPGDTLFSISVRLGKTIYDLQIKNNLANPNFIYPGQVLVIP